MILDKLMEKKDMLTFITFRIKILQEAKRKEPVGIPKKKIEGAKRQLDGRIKELKYIKSAIEQNDVKELSKRFWQEIAKNYTLKGEIENE